MGAASSWIPGSLESFSSGPEDVPKALRPLLDLRLDELCELYQKFAGQEQLQPQSVARELRLDQRNAELLVKKLDSFDLLVLLVVVSHTHFLTKVNFLFAMCTEEGFLEYSSFRKVLSSFLRAVWRLGSGTRRMVSASPTVLDSLAFSLFRSHDPALSRDTFSRMATDDVVGTLLRRFSAGRAEHVVSVAPWHTMGRRKVQEDVSSPSSAMVKTYVDDLDQPLPRRKGYFLAVQSARESALYQELEHIKVERMKDAKERTRSNLDLELREAEIRKELRGEVEDDVARREYRRKVQKFWHTSRPNSAVCRRHKVVCQGHLWTASSNHLARGGVLPAGVPRPITPTALQRALKSVISSSSQPSRTIADRVLKEFQSDKGKGDVQKNMKRITSVRGKAFSMLQTDDKLSQTSSDEADERCLFKRSAVLEAFKLYRSDYWLTQGGGIRSLLKSGLPMQVSKDLSAADAAWRRKVELDLMFQEVAEENCSIHTPAASQELTLRGFLKAVFPLAKKTDIWTMMKWIKRPQKQNKIQSQQKIAKPDLGLLRDVIELFDAIDAKKTGYVPIEAVEQFLSGEIVTQGEHARLNQRRQARTNQRSVTDFVSYKGNPRAALILNRTLDDRPEWSVSPSEENTSAVARQGHHRNSLSRRTLEQRMDALSSALDSELYQLALGDDNLISETIEAASNPCHHEHLESVNEELYTGQPGMKKVRLVRLYWRYMVGSAIVQQLREDSCCLELKDGKLDLMGFMCVLAQDQVNTIFALSPAQRVGSGQIRRLAYAFD